MSFNDRMEIAVAWEDQVRNKLDEFGFLTNRYGQGVHLEPPFSEAIRRMYDSKTALFIRYLPDWIIAVKDKLCYLIEAKATQREDTPNYSYELESHRVGMDLHSIGVDVIVVFKGWRADFLHNLHFIKQFDNKKYLSRVHGSRTPFGLILKDSVPMFDVFFQGLICQKE